MKYLARRPRRVSFSSSAPAVPIGVYELSVALPGDLRVQKVVEQSPRPKRSEVLPRVRLDRFGEQQGATLQLAAMKQGDRTTMTLNVVPVRPSYGWLLVGLLMAAAYLVGFRGLVSTDEATAAAPSPKIMREVRTVPILSENFSPHTTSTGRSTSCRMRS